MKRLLREPLVHFLLLGAILFGVYAYTERRHGGVEQSKQIQLTIDDLSQMVLVFRSQWLRDPTPEELRQLVEEEVHEEVLYREALAIGIDKDDTIVKRRMAQKMQFLAEDVAAAREPTLQELGRWYEANRDQFAVPPRVSFRHLYFSPDRRGAHARDDAAAAMTKLAGQPEDSNLAATLADAFMFQEYYRDRAPEFLGKEFGPNFALAVAKLSSGSWQGPVESGMGWHLVFVDTLITGFLAVAGAYVLHGIEHILFGFDHLLFVLALILIVRSGRVLLWTVTAFTIAHSITLSLATLGVVHVPGPPVEAMIALSILLLACEIVRLQRGQVSMTAQWPWIVAFSFGLLHGFGFAGALTQIGLPQGDIPLALFTFNVGVEVGQLIFIAAVLGLLAAARRFKPAPIVERHALPIATYAIGTMAAFWFIERLAGFAI